MSALGVGSIRCCCGGCAGCQDGTTTDRMQAGVAGYADDDCQNCDEWNQTVEMLGGEGAEGPLPEEILTADDGQPFCHWSGRIDDQTDECDFDCGSCGPCTQNCEGIGGPCTDDSDCRTHCFYEFEGGGCPDCLDNCEPECIGNEDQCACISGTCDCPAADFVRSCPTAGETLIDVWLYVAEGGSNAVLFVKLQDANGDTWIGEHVFEGLLNCRDFSQEIELVHHAGPGAGGFCQGLPVVTLVGLEPSA